jgi:tetratricopeptide (TPR) repeat protein
MSGMVESHKDRIVCLKEVLKLDPGNLLAIRGLRLLDENIEDPSPAPGVHALKRDWKTSLEMAESNPAKPKGVRRKIIAWSALGLLAVAVVITGIALGTRPRYRPDTANALKFSLTPPPTATTGITPSQTFEGPVPLWTLLDATFTPTPLYVVTPHSRTEAYRAAMVAYQKGDWGRALDYFKQVLNDEPNSPDMHYYIGEVYRFQKSYSNAIAAYDSAIKLDPSFAPAYLGKGRAQLQGTPVKPKDAIQNFEKALELDPALHEATLELANASIENGDAEQALSWVDQLDSVLPNSALIETIRARAYLLMGDNDLALKAVKKANQLDITSLPVYLLWGEILQENEQFENSIEPLNTYLTYVPADPRAEILLAKAMFETGEMDTALTILDKLLKTDDKSVTGLVTRGEIYLLNEDNDLAAKDFESALRLEPKSSEANIGYARVMLSQDYPGLAYEYAKVGVEYAKGDRQKAVALYWRAISLIGLKETKAAIRDLEAVLAYPEAIIPLNLREQVLKAYMPLVTPTPSLSPSATVKPSGTPKSDKTPTLTRTPTRTPTP